LSLRAYRVVKVRVMFRVYKAGDEGGIVSLLRECFSSYREWGLTVSDWFNLRSDDPGFLDSLVFVAEDDGTIAGHVQAVLKDLRVDGRCMSFGGIANVATKPSYRGRGIASNLLRMAHDSLRNMEIHLAMLYTGLRGVPHRVYRRLGYVDLALERREVCSVKDVLDEVETYKLEFDVREVEEGDRDALLKLYNEWSKIHGGICREKGYWSRIIGERRYYHTFFYDTRGILGFLAEREGPEGYVILAVPKLMNRGTWMRSDTAEVIDMVYRSKGAAYALLRHVAKFLERIGVKELVISSPEKLLWSSESVNGEGVLMGLLLDQTSFMESMSEVLSERLDESGLGADLKVKLETECGVFTLRVRGSEVKVSKDEELDDKIHMGSSEFLRMILGFRGFSEEMIEKANLISVSWRKLRTILQLMFPRSKPVIQPIDIW